MRYQKLHRPVIGGVYSPATSSQRPTEYSNCVQAEWKELFEVGPTCSNLSEKKVKLNYLLGISPKERDPKFAAQDEQDSMVMSQLWNTMVPEISDTIMFLRNAQDTWEAILFKDR